MEVAQPHTSEEEAIANEDAFRLTQPRIRLRVSSGSTTLEAALRRALDALCVRDEYGFFQTPVDLVAVPDYSSIISKPMDFSVMKSKLGEYQSFDDLLEDFELICTNAMTYNASATIYYKSAQKLLHYGRRFIRKEAVRFASNREEGGRMKKSKRRHPNAVLTVEERRLLESKIALFRRTTDGNWLFSSRNRMPVDQFYNADGSLNIVGNDVREMLLNPLFDASLAIDQSIGASQAHIVNPTQSLVPQHHFPFYDSNGYLVDDFESSALALIYGDPKGREFVNSLESFGATTLANDVTAGGYAILQELKAFAATEMEAGSTALDLQLGELSRDLLELLQMQQVRLLQGKTTVPTLEEKRVLSECKNKIAALARQAFPRDYVSRPAVRGALDVIAEEQHPPPFSGTMNVSAGPAASSSSAQRPTASNDILSGSIRRM